MAWDSLPKMDSKLEEMTACLERSVSWIEMISTIFLTAMWVLGLESHITRGLSKKDLLFFNQFTTNFWCPLFALTNPVRIFCWFLRDLARSLESISNHFSQGYRRRSRERFAFCIEGLGMMSLCVPYSLGVRGTVLYFSCCAIPCLVLFPVANMCYLRLWLADFWQPSSSPTSLHTNDPFLEEIRRREVLSENGELKETTAHPPHRLDHLNGDDGSNDVNIPDLVEEDTEEPKDEEKESDKVVLSEAEERSFVMLELNKDEELQDSSSAEPREEQTETILAGELENVNEYEVDIFISEMMDADVAAELREQREKVKNLEKEVGDLKEEGQKVGKSLENLKKSFEELISNLSAATSQAEFYCLQAHQDKENIGKLEEDKTHSILKLCASELYRTLLHDYKH